MVFYAAIACIGPGQRIIEFGGATEIRSLAFPKEITQGPSRLPLILGLLRCFTAFSWIMFLS